MNIKFDYQKICSDVLKEFPPRTIDIIERRFGLKSGKEETLEAIGKKYGLTRERIRQIEKDGFFEVKKKARKYESVFNYFKNSLNSFGGIKEEKAFLDFLVSSNKKTNTQNSQSTNLSEERIKKSILFLLFTDKDLHKILETKDLKSFWEIDKKSFSIAKKIIKLTISLLKKEKKPLKIKELFSALEKDFQKITSKKISKNIFQSYIEISKEIQKNPNDEYGLPNWVEINPRGIKDRIYLVLKKEKKPLHFQKITDLIQELPFSYKRKANIATVHNELIKNKHFILVGRGLYALDEWGYTEGMVKNVIATILKDAGKPLSKEEISKKVLEKRLVKKSTVFLNLNDKNYFLRDENGKYRIKEA